MPVKWYRSVGLIVLAAIPTLLALIAMFFSNHKPQRGPASLSSATSGKMNQLTRASDHSSRSSKAGSLFLIDVIRQENGDGTVQLSAQIIPTRNIKAAKVRLHIPTDVRLLAGEAEALIVEAPSGQWWRYSWTVQASSTAKIFLEVFTESNGTKYGNSVPFATVPVKTQTKILSLSRKKIHL